MQDLQLLTTRHIENKETGSGYVFDRRTWPAAAIVAIAICLLNYPWLIWGMQYGHDSGIHMLYFHAFSQQYESGELYPRWISGLNDDTGGPIFFVQYPLPYYAGLTCQWLFRIPHTMQGESRALGTVFFIGAVCLGLSLFMWCRRFTGPYASAFASIAGLSLPYLLWVDFYTRTAIGECLALGCMPLALCFSHDLDDNPVRAICVIGITIATLILCHLFSAILFLPFLVFYVLCQSQPGKSGGSLFRVTCGVILGTGLASIYLLPLLFHRRYFDMVRFENQAGGNFNVDDQLFPINSSVIGRFPSGWWVLNVVLIIAAACILTLYLFRRRSSNVRSLQFVLVVIAVFIVSVTAASPLLGKHFPIQRVETASTPVLIQRSRMFGFGFVTFELAIFVILAIQGWRDERLQLFFSGAVIVAFVLTTRWSAPLWKHLHVLWSIQFPWRFFGPMSIFTIGLLSLWIQKIICTEQRKWLRVWKVCAVGTVCTSLALLSAIALDVPAKFLGRLPRKSVPLEYVKAVDSGFSIYGHAADMLFPAYAHTALLYASDLPWTHRPSLSATEILAGEGQIHLRAIAPRHRVVDANCSSDCTLQLHLLYYPAWEARDLSGIPISLYPSPETGLTEISLKSGRHTVDLILPRDRGEDLGLIASLISFAILASLAIWDCRHVYRTRKGSSAALAV
jgi:hypothetical protein